MSGFCYIDKFGRKGSTKILRYFRVRFVVVAELVNVLKLFSTRRNFRKTRYAALTLHTRAFDELSQMYFFFFFCRQDDYNRRTVSDENVRTRVGHHVHVTHIDLREHSVLLLHEEVDDSEENDGIENVSTKHFLRSCPISHG